MVRRERLELSTNALKGHCSAIELSTHKLVLTGRIELPCTKHTHLKRARLPIPTREQNYVLLSVMTHAEKFDEFHTLNPSVYTLFKKFAFEAIKAGRKRLSTKLIVERMRWEAYVDTAQTDEFKINNNHTAYYARLFMSDYPAYKDFFVTRVTAGEKVVDPTGLEPVTREL